MTRKPRITLRERLARWLAPPPPDPIVSMLVRELDEAAKALDVASASMKHSRVTPQLIVMTRASFRRAASIVESAVAARKIELPQPKGEEYASKTTGERYGQKTAAHAKPH